MPFPPYRWWPTPNAVAPTDYRRRAQAALPQFLWNYLEGAAGLVKAIKIMPSLWLPSGYAPEPNWHQPGRHFDTTI